MTSNKVSIIRIILARIIYIIKKHCFYVLDFRSVTINLESYNIHKDTDKRIEFKRYSTNTKEYSTWIDNLFEKSPFNYFQTSLILPFVIFLIGLMFSMDLYHLLYYHLNQVPPN